MEEIRLMNIPSFTGFIDTSQVVLWDFFHPQTLNVWNIYIPTFTIINIPYMEVLVMISFHEETTPSFFNVKVENHQLNPKTPN